MPSINTSLLMLELSKDEERLHKAIREFMSSPSEEPGTCGECGHQLTVDNYVLHHSIHLEDVKQAKLKLLYPPRKRSDEDEEEDDEDERVADDVFVKEHKDAARRKVVEPSEEELEASRQDATPKMNAKDLKMISHY